jgi:hypothetical protein
VGPVAGEEQQVIAGLQHQALKITSAAKLGGGGRRPPVPHERRRLARPAPSDANAPTNAPTTATYTNSVKAKPKSSMIWVATAPCT